MYRCRFFCVSLNAAMIGFARFEPELFLRQVKKYSELELIKTRRACAPAEWLQLPNRPSPRLTDPSEIHLPDTTQGMALAKSEQLVRHFRPS